MSELEPTPGAAWPPPPAPADRPGGSSRRVRRLIVVAVVVAVVAVVGYVGLVFLGGQVKDVLRGTIELGSGPGEGCTVTGATTTFAQDDTIHYAVHLAREVPAGEQITVRLLRDGSEVGNQPQTYDTSGECVTGSATASDLDVGRYRLEYAAGAELLASGEFEVVP